MSKYQEYEDYSQTLADRVDGLLNLYEILPKNMPPGSVLQLELEDGDRVDISKKQLKQKRAELITEIRKTLPKKFKQAGKRKRKTKPSDFSGAYTPVVVADAIRQFLLNIDLGNIVPKDTSSPKLLEQLPCIQRGYGLRNSFQLLWYISIYVNDLQDEADKTMLRPNKAMSDSFGNKDYPTCYINTLDDEGKLKTVRNKDNLTTFEALEYRVNNLDKKEEPFDYNHFKIYAFPIILSLNIFKHTDLSQEVRDTLKREDIRQQMLKECEIIKETKDKWKEYIQQKRKDES